MAAQTTSAHHKPTQPLVATRDGDRWVINPPRSLQITWGGDSRYWYIPPDDPENRTKPVELLQVSWLEVTGSIVADPLPKGRELIFRFKVKLKSDAFGWKNAPVYMMARFAGGSRSWKRYDLSLLPKEEIVEIPIRHCPRVTVPSSAAPGGKIEFGMYEIWTGTWKGGLFIHGVVVQEA